LDRDLLMLTEQHRRIFHAVIDDGIVQAAEARAGVHGDIFEIIALDEIDDNVGLPSAQLVVRVAAHFRLPGECCFSGAALAFAHLPARGPLKARGAGHVSAPRLPMSYFSRSPAFLAMSGETL